MIKTALHSKIEVEVTEGEVAWNLLEAEGMHYLAVVNTLRERGKHYGHFGKVLEKGVAQDIALLLHGDLVGVCYDLRRSGEIPSIATGKGRELRFHLSESDGAILAFMPARIASIELKTAIAENDLLAPVLCVSALLHLEGKAQPGGIIPIEVVLQLPDGSRSDRSHFTSMRKGHWEAVFPLEYNAPFGEHKLIIRELASGKSGEAKFRRLPDGKWICSNRPLQH